MKEIETGDVCCTIKVASLRYLIIAHRSPIESLDIKPLNSAQNETDFDDKLSQESRKLTYLYLINDQRYGYLISSEDVTDMANPEISRILENHDLWEKRYIQKNVRKFVNRDRSELSKVGLGDYIEKSKCYDTIEANLFTEEYINELNEELVKDPQLIKTSRFQENILSIFNFYIKSSLCQHFQGSQESYYNIRTDFFTATSQSLPDDHSEQYWDAILNVYLVLNQEGNDYQGGGITFARYGCNTTLTKGSILITPSDLTHISYINPVTSGTFKFLKFRVNGGRSICKEVHGRHNCVGFERLDFE